MPVQRPWGPNNPNSEHQIWSRWLFRIRAGAKRPTREQIRVAAMSYARQVFKTSIGRVRLTHPSRRPDIYVLTFELEGPTAQDAWYRSRIEDHFRSRFVGEGFGPGATLASMRVSILAGDAQDGRPRRQLIVLPELARIVGGD